MGNAIDSTKIDLQLKESVEDIQRVFHPNNLFGLVTIHKKYFYNDLESEDSPIIMFGHADRVDLKFFADPAQFKPDLCKTDSGVRESTYHFYRAANIEDDRGAVKSTIEDAYCSRALVFFTSLYFDGDAEDAYNFVEDYFRDLSPRREYDCWAFHSLNSERVFLIISSDTYQEVTHDLTGLINQKAKNIVANTYVGCVRKNIENWQETLPYFAFEATRKKADPSIAESNVYPKLDELMIRYDKVGSSDYFYAAKQPIAGRDAAQLLYDIKKENVFYDVISYLGCDQCECTSTYPRPDSNKETELLERLKETKLLEKLMDICHQTIKIDIPVYGIDHNLLYNLHHIFSRFFTQLPIKAFSYDMLCKSLEGFIILYNKPGNVGDKLKISSKYISEVVKIMENTLYGFSITSNSPGNTDMLAPIPEQMVEIYYRFADALSLLLRFNTPNPKDKYFYLLSPDAASTVKTDPFFESRQNNCEELLQIGFPQHFLFMPKVFFPALVHEIAHFSGSTTRLRKKRTIAMLEAVACFIANVLTDRIEDEENELALGDNEVMRAFFSATLKRSYRLMIEETEETEPQSKSTPEDQDAFYMEKFREYAVKCVRDACEEMRVFELASALNNAATKNGEEHRNVGYLSKMIGYHLYDFTINKANDLIFLITNIVTEAYCDCVAIKVLGITAEDYFNMMHYNGVSILLESRDKAPLVQERIHIICMLFGWSLESGENEEHLCKEKYAEWDVKFSELSFMPRIRNILVDKYFKHVLKELDERKDQFQSIKEMYEKLPKIQPCASSDTE